jgi:hypothetical protein
MSSLDIAEVMCHCEEGDDRVGISAMLLDRSIGPKFVGFLSLHRSSPK